MTKTKPSIVKKNLSWENKKKDYLCDYKNCFKIGKFKAPKSRSNLNNYYFFCLTHVKEYNKSWDFYKGLSVDQIELSIRKDTVWDRPSWPLTGNPSQIINQIRDLLNSDYNLFEKEKNLQKFLINKIIDENLTPQEQKCIDVLGISMPIKINNIKKAYKKLVKIFHPDVNKDGKEAEKRFKEINEAYTILLKKFLKTNIVEN